MNLEIPNRFRGRLFLSPTEVAGLVPLCAKTITRRCEKGYWGARKDHQIGGRWLIPAEEIWYWLGLGETKEHKTKLQREARALVDSWL